MSDVIEEVGGLGLDSLGDLSSLLDDSQSASTENGPMSISIDLIDEDPNQPRTEENPGFSSSSLSDLALTIESRGVKTPISVRVNEDSPGRFIINHGARRFRGSKLAKKDTIPAFIDNDYNEADQVIENLQRNELTAREIADYIGREIAKGIAKNVIASTIGKSSSFVSQHVVLLDLPAPIAVAFNSGRVNDVTVINELVKAYKKSPDQVEAWLDDEDQELTRNSVKLLREFIDENDIDNDENSELNEENKGFDDNSSILLDTSSSKDNEPDDELGSDSDLDLDSDSSKKDKEEDPDKFKKAIVMVKHDERMGRLLLTRRPSSEGLGWVKYDDDGHEFETDLGEVQIMALMEG